MPEDAAMLVVSEEVREALHAARPVVALESTFFTHGLPAPRRLDMAVRAEQDLRAAGVTPATVGIVDGQPTVGLSRSDIERLCRDDAVIKATVRDLPIAAAKRLCAGTTVASTALLAHQAGLRVFATGGLGGVHRGAAHTFDESADLTTLASTPLTVVSSGVKSILDIPATLERLETLNIPVVGYRTNRYPAFYVADSGYEVPHSAASPAEVAAMISARDALGLRSALLVANPVPVDQQLDPDLHDAVITEALREAEERGISGHAATPFLLDRIVRATDGRSLEANIALYLNNVAVGGLIARALAS